MKSGKGGRLGFEFFADKKYFVRLLGARDNQEFQRWFDALFDFRRAAQKRREFKAIRRNLFAELVQERGHNCQLRLDAKCQRDTNLVVDHFIPLASNEVNKKLRRMKAPRGKKVLAQSFGSNLLATLVLACGHCNGKKKHRIPDAKLVKQVLGV
jgi:5-methylcytosine-specific restriction endonuclease McrA